MNQGSQDPRGSQGGAQGPHSAQGPPIGRHFQGSQHHQPTYGHPHSGGASGGHPHGAGASAGHPHGVGASAGHPHGVGASAGHPHVGGASAGNSHGGVRAGVHALQHGEEGRFLLSGTGTCTIKIEIKLNVFFSTSTGNK
jgi:hypothetical protein